MDPILVADLGLQIQHIDGKGRGVIATRPLASQTLVEVSPVILFTSEEYESHGKHTILDEYTFCWPGRDGTMALALGLGSLFNHNATPNLIYSIDKSSQTIRFTTTRPIEAGEELCIFYAHKLWFEDTSLPTALRRTRRAIRQQSLEEEAADMFGGLAKIDIEKDALDEFVQDSDLPFEEVKYMDSDEEDPDDYPTTDAWIVDVPDTRYITVLLDYVRQLELDTPDLAHLKRIRKSPDSSQAQLLLALAIPQLGGPLPPLLSSPPVVLNDPQVTRVPATPGRTLEAATRKSLLWPTVYQPRRREREARRWTNREVKEAWRGIRTCWEVGRRAGSDGELPIGAYVPPLESARGNQNGVAVEGGGGTSAHDTRQSEQHPLRHAVMNLLRNASSPSSSSVPASSSLSNGDIPTTTNTLPQKAEKAEKNGQWYLLTSRTLFTTHEPCIMCSMALLHSRVKDVFFIYPMKETGGCGGLRCVPGMKGVNHRFGIWRWKDPSVGGGGGGEGELRVEERVDA